MATQICTQRRTFKRDGTYIEMKQLRMPFKTLWKSLRWAHKGSLAMSISEFSYKSGVFWDQVLMLTSFRRSLRKSLRLTAVIENFSLQKSKWKLTLIKIMPIIKPPSLSTTLISRSSTGPCSSWLMFGAPTSMSLSTKNFSRSSDSNSSIPANRTKVLTVCSELNFRTSSLYNSHSNNYCSLLNRLNNS